MKKFNFQYVIIVIFVGILSVGAQNTQTIQAHSDDITIRNNNTSWGWVGQTTSRLGYSSGQAFVIPFQLPILQSGESITSADLKVEVISYSNQPSSTNIDLYGLPYRATSAVNLNSDYYMGALDNSATIIKDNIFVDSVTGSVNLDENSQQNLISYINAQYSLGAVGGDFIFIRFSADANSTETWNLASQDNSDSSIRPILDITITDSTIINTAPLIDVIPNHTVEENAIIQINIVSIDNENNPITISSNNLPSFGNLIDAGNGTATLTFNPMNIDIAEYQDVEIIADDGELQTSEFFDLSVIQSNVAPIGAYYCDPINGNNSNNGSAENPFASFSSVNWNNIAINNGDVIYLMDGYHGSSYFGNKVFTEDVTIKALNNHSAVLGKIQLDNVVHVKFEGIKFDATGVSYDKNDPIFFADDETNHITVDNCIIQSAESSALWTKTDWYNNSASGFQFRGNNITLINNKLLNLYHAVELRGDYSVMNNNLIDNFCADAIRGLGSNSTYENNIVRDCYIDDYAIQHDDGFQAFKLDGDRKISNVTIRNNKFMIFEDPITQFVIDNNLIGTLMQGVIITDGYADSWIVENNLVVSNKEHGISLYGARHCRVQNNTVVQHPHFTDIDGVPKIMLTDQSKTGQTNFDNIIRNNLCAQYTPWTYDSTSIVENNVDIDQTTYSNYSNYFVDYVGGDFHLSATSPAIDAGVNTDLAPTDLDGNSRSMGNSVDAGAYEFTGTVTPPANNLPILASIGNIILNELDTIVTTISATDGDNDTLVISIENAPNFSTFVDNGDGTASLSLSPQIGDANSYSITVSVTDEIDTTEEIILVTINEEGSEPVNNSPIIANVTNQSVEENGILNVNISATDSDSDTLTLTTTSLPNFAVFTDNGDGTALFEFNPLVGDAGTYTINVEATDGIDAITSSYVLSVSEYSDVIGTAYYCDPVNGSMSNSGTQANPWRSLEDVFTASKTFNSGDVIYLLTGAHGSPFITGTHSDYVTIRPLSGENPVVASIQVENASYWAFDGLTFSTNGSGGNFARDYMFLTKDNATYLKIENSTFSCAENSSAWSKNDWYANSEDAIIIRGDNVIFNNNTIKNVYFALQIEGDFAEVKNNLIDNFGADAIRALGSHAIYENNIIRDAYIEDYSINHDDGIQMYDKDNVAAGIIDDVIIRNNKIYNFADPITQSMVDDNLVGYSMQGIIITDGHTENVFVENNLVVSDHYHGITLTGAISCKIQNNTVSKTPTSYNPTTDATPWIQVKNDKQGNGSTGNIIRNNIATKFTPWTYDEALNTTENNIVATANDATSFYADYNNFNFSLKDGSPAIDAGVNTGLTATDINGNLRSVGASVDCGAFEFQVEDDITAPTIANAYNSYYNDEFIIVFSESITAVTAEHESNYTIDNGVTVNSAILSGDMRTVTLTTSELTGNINHTITANNIKDFAGNTSNNSSASFVYECDTDWASSFQDDQWGYNPSSNAFDNDLATKWASEGNQWIQKSFCEVTMINSVDITFGLGDERAYSFVIEVSTNGRDYAQVISATSTGTTNTSESFDFEDVSAKYVRITGSGSDVNDWNNYSEIVINTSGYVPPTNTAPVLATIGNQTMLEGETLIVNVSATDADGDVLSFTANILPSFATFVDNGNGTSTLTLSPLVGDASTTDIIISVSDGTVSDSETVNIIVDNDGGNPINNEPVLSTVGSQTIDVNESRIINISSVDIDGDTLEYTISNAPSFATFIDNSDGTAQLTLSPIIGDEGVVNITITVSDGELNDSEVINIQVNSIPQVNNYSVEASEADQSVYYNGGMQWIGYHTHRLGSNYKTSAIIPFQIPTLELGERLTSATLNFYLLQSGGGLEHKVDLYGLPFRSSSAVLSSDYFAGTYDTDQTATAIENDILDLNSQNGNLQSSSSQAIIDFVNAQLDNGAVAGDFIFFRFSLDYNGSGNYNYWDIASQDHSASNNRPILNFETGQSSQPVSRINNIKNAELENSNFKIYPNPVNNGILNISTGLLDNDCKVEIYNLNDSVVFRSKISKSKSHNKEILINLEAGMYFVRIYNNSTIITKKLIVQ